LGDVISEGNVGFVNPRGYPTVEIVVAKGSGSDFISGVVPITEPVKNLVISADYSGSDSLGIGGVDAVTITDTGVSLTIGLTDAEKIDASNAPVLAMGSPSEQSSLVGVTVFGGTGPGNILQGSIGPPLSFVTFSNGGTGVSVGAGADNIKGGSGGSDLIFGDGGPDTISLPNHSLSDAIAFGEFQEQGNSHVLAMTDGMDLVYPGSWGVGTTPSAIPSLFLNATTGGTSADMTVITGFHAGSSGDLLEFKVKAWNGASSVLASKGL
jgi:hypothetical protein